VPLVVNRENTVALPTKPATVFHDNGFFNGLTAKNKSGCKHFLYIIYFDPGEGTYIGFSAFYWGLLRFKRGNMISTPCVSGLALLRQER